MKSRALRSVLFFVLIMEIAGCKPKTSTIPAGLDLFQTEPGTTFFNFEELPIPARFFAADSRPFTGTVKFAGGMLPPSYFKGRDLPQVDTIVRRQKTLTLSPPYPASGTVPIEMIALSLVSEEPIRVETGTQVELWDVLVELSRHRSSKGTMTITKTDDHGGIFDSQLVVFPTFRFIRQSDGAQKTLDVGAMELSEEMLKRLTLRSGRAPWRHVAPPGVLSIKGMNDNFIAGAPGRMKETGDACAHVVREPASQPPPVTCTVTARRDDTKGTFRAQGKTNYPGATVSIHNIDTGAPCVPSNASDSPFLPNEIVITGSYVFQSPTTSTNIPGVCRQVLVKAVSLLGRRGHCCAIVQPPGEELCPVPGQ